MMERDFFDELGDTITKATKNLGKKANEFYETQKIRGRISSEEHMIRKLKCDIGNLIYEKYKDGEMPEKALKGFCEEICQHEQIIKGYEKTAADMKGKKICPECGKPITQISGRKPKRFCSPECRQKWWNAHPERVGQKAVYEYVCPGCGQSFTAYGNSHRKYCSHECYVETRFKGGEARD